MVRSTETNQDSNSLTGLASELSKLRNTECDLCPIHKDTERRCLIGNHPTMLEDTPRLVVLGEAPGGNEERTGTLFSGAAGQLLWSRLKAHRINREACLVTNAVRCRPENNRTPTPAEIRTCMATYGVRELEVVRPKYGLALGNVGLRATLNRTGITSHNGSIYEALGVKWVAAFHPAAVLRNPRYSREFDAALLVFSRLVRDEEGAPTTVVAVINSGADLPGLIKELDAAKKASIDTETDSDKKVHGRFSGSGLAWWDPSFRVASIQFSFMPGKAYVLPLWHKEARWKNPARVVEILKPHIERVPRWICQNGKFDEHVLRAIGIHISQSFDTMGAVYALDENSRKDLGFLAKCYLGAPDYKELVAKGGMSSVPLEALAPYGAKDADYTLRLEGPLRRRLREDGLAGRLFDSLLMPAVRVLSFVEAVGLPVHHHKFEVRKQATAEKIQSTAAQLNEYAGGPFNPNSPRQVAKMLYDRLNFPVVESTRTGPSTSERALKILMDYDEVGVIPVILDYRQWAGYMSRYFLSWEYFLDPKNRLHPTFKPFHTVTGRLSAANPNVQQIPRDQFVRGLIGGRKGWTIIEADYSQVELRIVAHVSQDRTMMRAFNIGRDIHLETAMAVTGLSESEITPEIRKKAKAVNFGFVYGMGWRKFIEYGKTNYGITVSPGEAQDTRKAFFATFHSLPAWHERQRSAAQRRKWVISPIGRKRHLWDIDSTNESIRAEAERQAINSPIQSMASDMMLLSMVLLHPKLDPKVARIISTVHDSLILEVRDEAVDDTIPIIKETMENLPLEEMFGTIMTVPIRVDFKVGPFWSEGAKELKGI